MPKLPEVDSIITAILESRFADAHHNITSSSEPIALQATLSLIYLAEVGFQLKEIATALRRIERLQRGPIPTTDE